MCVLHKFTGFPCLAVWVAAGVVGCPNPQAPEQKSGTFTKNKCSTKTPHGSKDKHALQKSPVLARVWKLHSVECLVLQRHKLLLGVLCSVVLR